MENQSTHRPQRLNHGPVPIRRGPGPEHSAYETIFTDADDKTLVGANGTYQLTTTAPPVDAFWSVTVYDTDRGGFLHPNKKDRYHINNTSAIPNDDETYTFNFRTACEPGPQLFGSPGRTVRPCRQVLPTKGRNRLWGMADPPTKTPLDTQTVQISPAHNRHYVRFLTP